MSPSSSSAVSTVPTSWPAAVFSTTLRAAVEEVNVGGLLVGVVPPTVPLMRIFLDSCQDVQAPVSPLFRYRLASPILQLAAGFASSLSEAVFLTLPVAEPDASSTMKYVVSFARVMPEPDAVNAWMLSLATEPGFVSVPRLAPGDPLLSELMLTVRWLKSSALYMWMSTLVSVYPPVLSPVVNAWA